MELKRLTENGFWKKSLALKVTKAKYIENEYYQSESDEDMDPIC